MNILVTGGLGFIGSHTVVELLLAGHKVTIADSLINSDLSVIDSIFKITNKKPVFKQLDIRDADKLHDLMKKMSIEAVIHFAALKAVGESVEKPLEYYKNNIDGLLSVLESMKKLNISNLIFSSSATVYGDPDRLPILETAPLKTPTNPYGATKQMAEQIISDCSKAYNIKAVLLRYFNPIGAHPSGLIGELPKGTPNNLVPFVTQAAAGIRKSLTVFGDNYDTPDGSGIRDYIHVVDLAKAHVKALEYVKNTNQFITALNVGTGHGVSVLEVIKTFENVNKIKVPYTIGPRRNGDIASCYAGVNKAEKVLGWKAELSLKQALKDAWRWQTNLSKTTN